MATTAQNVTDSPTAWRPSGKVRALISALLLVHLLAVFVGPWAMPPQGSLLATTIARALQPYLQAVSLDNGYRFFAPEPGPSHLLRYQVELPDGKIVDETFPDRNRQRPRLLYHRYFMMSEFLNSMFENEGAKDIRDAYARSYARHLARTYDAKQVTLFLRQHNLPSPKQVADGLKLDDPSLYEEVTFGPYAGDEL